MLMAVLVLGSVANFMSILLGAIFLPVIITGIYINIRIFSHAMTHGKLKFVNS